MCTHAAMERTHVAETRLFPLVREAKIEASFGGIARARPRDPLGLANLLKIKGRELAERVGFAPSHLVDNKGLGRIQLPPDPLEPHESRGRRTYCARGTLSLRAQMSRSASGQGPFRHAS